MLVEKKDIENVQQWFLAKGIDSIHGQRLCVVKDTDETFGIHPEWFNMDSREALIYQYIADKYDFKSMNIDMRNFQGAVRGIIYKEEQAFCKENGIYDNYVWDLYASPFLNGGNARLFATLRVKILNEKGYKRISFDQASKNDVSPWFGIYVRQEYPNFKEDKPSLSEQIQSASTLAAEARSDDLLNVDEWIDESKITDTARISVVWDSYGIAVDFNYSYDVDLGYGESVLCFAEIYDDGMPDERVWKEAQDLGLALKNKYNLPLDVVKDEAFIASMRSSLDTQIKSASLRATEAHPAEQQLIKSPSDKIDKSPKIVVIQKGDGLT